MIFFLIPVYNETANLKNLYGELTAWQSVQNIHYVFSDDGSKDRSKELITELFSGRLYTVLGDGINRGPGAAFNTGFQWILKNSKPEDIVVTLEADCTSDLKILNIMLGLQSMGYDLVLASVYAQGGGFEKTSFFRKFISAAANFMFRFLFDVKVLTLSSFYRVYSVSLLNRIQEKYNGIITEPGFVCMLEVLVRSIHCNAQVIEVPMQLHSSKRVGQSNMNVVKTTIQYFKYLLKGKSSQ
ncbi:MAG: glycosyltransferase [Cyclobacteriaceae bacterium]|nr:glycosyltransferase [Cyclobacteriaceae bacterium]